MISERSSDMDDKKILSALIGLAGAMSNNGRTDTTDEAVMDALISEKSDNTDIENAIEKIHNEKNKISPNCASCMNPCGNTSDYDMSHWNESVPEILRAKEHAWSELKRVVLEKSNEGKRTLPDVAYKMIVYLGYDMEPAEYSNLMEELRKW